jgi:outer membrane protein TolC
MHNLNSKIIHQILLFLILASGFIKAQVKEMRIDSLSIELATKIALENNPSIKIAYSNVDYSNAGLRLNRSSYFPNLSILGSAQRTEGAFVFNPSFPPREQQYNNYTAGFQLQQLIYDFGRTSGKVSAGEDIVNSSLYDLQSAIEDLMMIVQINCYTYIQAQYLERVDQEALAQTEEHLNVAQAFYRAGTQAEYDVTKAQVDVANARLNLIHSQNQIKVSKLLLENSLGIKIPNDFIITDSLKFDSLKISIDSVKSIALDNRTDLKSLKLKLSAQKSLVSSIWSQHLPSVSAFGNYNWNGFDFPLYSRWNAGINFSIPIFQGFAVNAQVQQAESQQKNLEASIEQLTLSILSEVQQNYLSVIEAENRIDAANQLVVQAKENFKLATQRYKSGVGSATEITDAQLALSNARYSNIQAHYDYLTSLVRLKRSMGLFSPINN